MATDFFEQQDRSRRRTAYLVACFFLGVICLILLTYLLAAALYYFYLADKIPGRPFHWTDLWHPGLFLAVSAGVAVVVGGSALLKVAELASGGRSVALMLGGKEVNGRPKKLVYRRLVNVVEEMAIASGVPMPSVFVLPDEPGINAFAAGYTIDDAVVAVSKGSLEYLTRDELQGVVAHEFSHILNGDMRLNIRLIAVIFGITSLTIIGYFLMRIGAYSRPRRSSSKKGDATAVIVLFGIGLYILGLVGAFFGRLIQAAISRQREYLADASAVQFTRNPDGIAGALKKIGGLEIGSKINNIHAAEISHMWIAEALFRTSLPRLLATHPPLEDRIRRLDPHFDGKYPRVVPLLDLEEVVEKEAEPPKPPPLPRIVEGPLPLQLAILEQLGRTGTISNEGMVYAREILAQIPEPIREAIEEPFAARAVLLAMLLNKEPDVRARQLQALQSTSDPRDYVEVTRLVEVVQNLPDVVHLPVIDLALPALRRMTGRQYEEFTRLMDDLIHADRKVTIFEYVLRTIVRQRLDGEFGIRRARPARIDAEAVLGAAQTVFSLLAWEGSDNEREARQAFAAAVEALGGRYRALSLLPRERIDMEEFDRAVRILSATTPSNKRGLLAACARCIAADKQITVAESELFRAVAEALGVPMPPFVATLSSPQKA